MTAVINTMPTRGARLSKADRDRRQLERTAYHEAGHAAMAHDLGHATHHVTIIPDREMGSLGHRQSMPLPEWLQPDIEITYRTEKRIEHEVLICLAGMAAEHRYCGRNNWRGAGGDFRTAIDMASYVHGMGKVTEKYISFMIESVRARMRSPRLWVQVEAERRLYWNTKN